MTQACADGCISSSSRKSRQARCRPNRKNVIRASTNPAVALAAGGYHSVALRADGTLVAWGNNDAGQTDVPAGLDRVVGITAGLYHNVALRADGTIRTWGLVYNGAGYDLASNQMVRPCHNIRDPG